jgi:hypothetical protein
MSQNRRPMRVSGLFLTMMLDRCELYRNTTKHLHLNGGYRNLTREQRVRMAAELIQFRFPKEKHYEDGSVERDGAGDRDRTGDIQLGKLAFYR